MPLSHGTRGWFTGASLLFAFDSLLSSSPGLIVGLQGPGPLKLCSAHLYLQRMTFTVTPRIDGKCREKQSMPGWIKGLSTLTSSRLIALREAFSTGVSKGSVTGCLFLWRRSKISCSRGVPAFQPLTTCSMGAKTDWGLLRGKTSCSACRFFRTTGSHLERIWELLLNATSLWICSISSL